MDIKIIQSAGEIDQSNFTSATHLVAASDLKNISEVLQRQIHELRLYSVTFIVHRGPVPSHVQLFAQSSKTIPVFSVEDEGAARLLIIELILTPFTTVPKALNFQEVNDSFLSGCPS